MNGMRRNIELKARLRELAPARAAVRELGAREAGVLVQMDTYFFVREGRMKLRETEGRGAELIWYRRADETALRDSNYRIAEVADPGEMKEELAQTLGVRGEVRKRRELWLWENVRIHLDEVEELGTFLEFEAVITSDAEAVRSPERLGRLIAAVGIREEDRIAGSYSDLLGF